MISNGFWLWTLDLAIEEFMKLLSSCWLTDRELLLFRFLSESDWFRVWLVLSIFLSVSFSFFRYSISLVCCLAIWLICSSRCCASLICSSFCSLICSFSLVLFSNSLLSILLSLYICSWSLRYPSISSFLTANVYFVTNYSAKLLSYLFFTIITSFLLVKSPSLD